MANQVSSGEVNIILSNNQIKKRQAAKASAAKAEALLGHSNNNIKKLQNLNKKIRTQSNPFLRQQLREERRKERRTLNLSNKTYDNIDYLERLIEEKNAAAKDAEEELFLYIKDGPPYKNEFNRNDVISSIDKIENLDINNSKYPNLLEWKEIHKELQSFIDKLPNNNTNNNYNKNRIIAEGRDHGFNVDAILKQLPQRRFLNRLPKLPKIFTRKNTQKNSSVRSATPVTLVTPVTPVTQDSKPWYQLWGGRRKTNRKTRHYKPSGGNPYMNNPYIGMDEASIQRQIEEMQRIYNTKTEKEKIILAGKIAHAKNALNYKLSAELKELENAGYGTRGGRKTHHKKRHMRKGSRKIHRK